MELSHVDFQNGTYSTHVFAFLNPDLINCHGLIKKQRKKSISFVFLTSYLNAILTFVLGFEKQLILYLLNKYKYVRNILIIG